MTTESTGQQIFDEYVGAYNAGAANGDFGPMVDRFADDGELVFEGLPMPPLVGREAIAAAYVEQPPDDGIDVTTVDEQDDGMVVARWEWRRTPSGGTMKMSHDGTRITHLDIAFDAPPPPEAEA